MTVWASFTILKNGQWRTFVKTANTCSFLKMNNYCLTNYICWKQACIMRLRRQFVSKVTNPVCRMAQTAGLKMKRLHCELHTYRDKSDMFGAGQDGWNMVKWHVCHGDGSTVSIHLCHLLISGRTVTALYVHTFLPLKNTLTFQSSG